MYNINSSVDKPDIQYMTNKIEELMKEGIALGDVVGLYNKLVKIKDEISVELKDKYGIANANSSKQICDYMKALNNIDVYEVACIDNAWSSKAEVLTQLANLGYSFANEILLYRKYKSYSESIYSMLSARGADGRVHPQVTLGKTNRINYRNPALMNIPKDLLWTLISPRKEDNVLISVDIKNQEPNILINLLGIDDLKYALEDERGLYEALFEEPFRPITKATVYVTADVEPRLVPLSEMEQASSIPPVYYTPIKPLVASTYYNGEKIKVIEICNTITKVGVKPILPDTVKIETVHGSVYEVEVEWEVIADKKLKATGTLEVQGHLKGTEVRCEGVYKKEFKIAWNAMTYGASSFGIKNMCKNINGDIVYKYFSKIKQFKEYKSRCNKLADNGIDRINTFFGTQLSAGITDRSRLQRVLMDLPIQGTGADILALLIKHFYEEVETREINEKLSLYYSRHDELILEADREWVESLGEQEVINIVRDILEHRIDNWTPFKVEIKVIENKEISLSDNNEDIFE